MSFSSPPMNGTNIADLVTYANTATGSWFGVLLVVSIFLISFITLKYLPFAKAMASSMYITMVFTAMLYGFTPSIISDYVLFIVAVIAGLSTIGIIYEAASSKS